MKNRVLCLQLCALLTAIVLVGCGSIDHNVEETIPQTETLAEETAENDEYISEAENIEPKVKNEADNSEIETIEDENTEGSETKEEPPSYSYTEMSMVMYAVNAVNVRDLPSVDGQKIGSLAAAQEVSVTGQCNETSWYRIDHNGQVGYVSNSYIVTEKPVMEVTDVIQPTEQSGLVSIGNLANKKSLQKKCTDEEFQAAYDAATQIVTPLIGLSREEQLVGIAAALRNMVDNGQVVYSTEAAHYNDPYGYLLVGVSSCAGCTRTTGLCLNMLGISYEHVNEDQWRHQWCRVNIDGTYWICDAYGLYVGPEPEPYVHPYLE
ncbi:MAG: SH3 domain-containing protein [Acetatifactor sp.]|nr:SH3 domain-containing protein [Acetatifactor sp.]